MRERKKEDASSYGSYGERTGESLSSSSKGKSVACIWTRRR
jgi:hypothetical protein